MSEITVHDKEKQPPVVSNTFATSLPGKLNRDELFIADVDFLEHGRSRVLKLKGRFYS